MAKSTLKSNYKSKSGVLNRFFYTKTWDSSKHSLLSQEEIEHRLYNNLPLDDVYDENISKYNKKKKNVNK